MDFPIPFTKMSGTGNDFILIDHRRPVFATQEEMQRFAKCVCERKFSVGADGLILIEKDATCDFAWRFFNGDGSLAEMCGNGARCAARFAHAKGIAPPRMRFRTLAGVIEAEVVDDMVRLSMTDPEELSLDLSLSVDGGERTVHSVNTGVPHVVHFVEDLALTPVMEWGRILRFHPRFAPAGTNANFVAVGDGKLLVRTYERGVEAETMACGTGAVAAALIAGAKGMVAPPVTVVTSGGEKLIVDFTLAGDAPPSGITLTGPAAFIYDGMLHPEALRRAGVGSTTST